MWDTIIFGQELESWTWALVYAVGGWVLGTLLYRMMAFLLKGLVQRTTTKLDDLLIGTIQGPLVVAVTLLGFYIGSLQLVLGPKATVFIGKAFHVGWTLCITWLLVRAVVGLLSTYVLPLASKRRGTELDQNMLVMLTRAANVIIWTLGVIAALNNIGYNVSALIAGIGISGLALAMAAKDTVANLFGGVTILADHPFSIGDRIRVKGYDGTVMNIGIRSTRIRTLDGPIVVVPNFMFTDSVLENVSERPFSRVRQELGLVCTATEADVRKAVEILNGIVAENAEALENGHSAFFESFKDWSLNIVFVYRIRAGQNSEVVQARINLAILERFRAAGLDFAYPTQVQLNG